MDNITQLIKIAQDQISRTKEESHLPIPTQEEKRCIRPFNTLSSRSQE